MTTDESFCGDQEGLQNASSDELPNRYKFLMMVSYFNLSFCKISIRYHTTGLPS
jgi:hypothetical protein